MLNLRQVKELFEYRDGDLYWKKILSNRVPKGSKVSGVNSLGYLRVRIDGECYMAHKVVWLYHYGYLPEMLDHIDGDPGNNRIENLRLCTKTTNGYNAKLSKRNSTGLKGLTWNKVNKNWRCGFHANGERVEVGSFMDKDEAIKALVKARGVHHGEFMNHGNPVNPEGA